MGKVSPIPQCFTTPYMAPPSHSFRAISPTIARPKSLSATSTETHSTDANYETPPQNPHQPFDTINIKLLSPEPTSVNIVDDDIQTEFVEENIKKELNEFLYSLVNNKQTYEMSAAFKEKIIDFYANNSATLRDIKKSGVKEYFRQIELVIGECDCNKRDMLLRFDFKKNIKPMIEKNDIFNNIIKKNKWSKSLVKYLIKKLEILYAEDINLNF